MDLNPSEDRDAVEGFYEHGNEPSRSIKCREIIE
jgi:hypothetical protein